MIPVRRLRVLIMLLMILIMLLSLRINAAQGKTDLLLCEDVQQLVRLLKVHLVLLAKLILLPYSKVNPR